MMVLAVPRSCLLYTSEITLETKDGEFFFFKADILSNQITYSSYKNIPANLVTISGRRAFEIIGLNRRGIKPDSLIEETHRSEPNKPVDLLEQELSLIHILLLCHTPNSWQEPAALFYVALSSFSYE